ncbi:methyltransferase domain-containing protein [Streptomyces bomunensis]|uniref:Protein-L-isoaspartate O-methyltransferase n=1 Tax=Streptomyces montanisoli TaxID=2798581 RepID=A0A940MKA3_9ACTN|nr:methyltransferase domain-containing protein [Streptomyces montanisoli]
MWEASPDGLASRLVESGALTTDWLPAFKAVPRELFVPDVMWPGRSEGVGQGQALDRREEPESWREAVYSDISLTTQWDDGRHVGKGKGTSPTCSNSQPSMVFSMLDALDVQPGCRVLEIGTGTGWNAALLSERVGSRNMTTVEVDPENARRARKSVRDAGYRPTMVVGDGADGWAESAPYDRVLVTASVTGIPAPVIRQSAAGAVIVAPYATTYGGGAVARLTVQRDGSALGPFIASAAFMRLRGHRTSRKHTGDYLGAKEWPADGDRSVTALSPEAVGDWLPMFVIGLLTSGVFPWAERYEDGSYTLWLRDAAVTSWATVDHVPNAPRFVVYQSGPRRLWDEVEAAYAWWESNGFPGYGRLGLTVDPDTGTHTPWLDGPDRPLRALG